MASTDDVRRLAALARLSLKDGEIEKFSKEFEGILSYVSQIEELSLDDLPARTAELQTALEELQTTNEELMSSGEELQALNEELETSTEELLSNNEELNKIWLGRKKTFEK